MTSQQAGGVQLLPTPAPTPRMCECQNPGCSAAGTAQRCTSTTKASSVTSQPAERVRVQLPGMVSITQTLTRTMGFWIWMRKKTKDITQGSQGHAGGITRDHLVKKRKHRKQKARWADGRHITIIRWLTDCLCYTLCRHSTCLANECTIGLCMALIFRGISGQTNNKLFVLEQLHHYCLSVGYGCMGLLLWRQICIFRP